MLMSVTCGRCGARHIVDEKGAGKTLKCRCGAVLQAPVAPQTPDAGRAKKKTDAGKPVAAWISMQAADTDREEPTDWGALARAAWSDQVVGSVVLLMAQILFLGLVLVMVGAAVLLVAYASEAAAWVTLAAQGQARSEGLRAGFGDKMLHLGALALLALGTVVAMTGFVAKVPFAICEAGCHGYVAPRPDRWSAARAGMLWYAAFALALTPLALLALLALAASRSAAPTLPRWLWAVGPVVGILSLLLWSMLLVSIAEAHGAWTGLAPGRVWRTLATLAARWAGVEALISLDVLLAAGLFMGLAYGGTSFGAYLCEQTGSSGGKFVVQALVLVGLLLIGAFLFLHPIVFRCYALGLLYRKHRRK